MSTTPSTPTRDPTDGLREALSDGRRRYVLRLLSEADGPVDLDALAVDVAAWAGESVTDARLALHHVHLPKLDNVGLVRYARGTNTVELADLDAGAAVDEVDRLLDSTERSA